MMRAVEVLSIALVLSSGLAANAAFAQAPQPIWPAAAQPAPDPATTAPALTPNSASPNSPTNPTLPAASDSASPSTAAPPHSPSSSSAKPSDETLPTKAASAQSRVATFPSGWIIQTELYGDAPLFKNERAQVLQAIYEWASARGARLMPADAYARLPKNRCAASATELAPLDAIYPTVGELGASASCDGSSDCTLSVWVHSANEASSGQTWTARVAIANAQELSVWLDAIANLQPLSEAGTGGLLAMTQEAEGPPLAIVDVDAYGTAKPVYSEDFGALSQALQACYAPTIDSGSIRESILLALVAGGRISGCEADVAVSIDGSGTRANCFCRAASAVPLAKQLATTGRARVRISLANRAVSTGPVVATSSEEKSPNFNKSINGSFGVTLGAMHACFAQHPVPLPDERRLKLTVSGSGHLQSAELTGGAANAALTQCLTHAIKAARFPCTEDNRQATFEATVHVTSRAAISKPPPGSPAPARSQQPGSQ